jgi:hypothetical protein
MNIHTDDFRDAAESWKVKTRKLGMRNGDVKVVGRTERGSLAVEIGGQKVVEIDSREVDG